MGASSWVENPRVYFAGGALKPGRNVIAIRLFKMKPDGGFLNPADDLRLTLGDGTVIPLGGEWKGKVAVDGRPPQPLPIGFENLPSMPGVLYRGMLEPIAPLALTGAIWYQGESNTERAYQYRTAASGHDLRLAAAVRPGRFPVLHRRPAGVQAPPDVPGTDDWAELREAQALTAKTVPTSCLAVTIDTGDPDNIHPKDKREAASAWPSAPSPSTTAARCPDAGPTLASVERLPAAR